MRYTNGRVYFTLHYNKYRLIPGVAMDIRKLSCRAWLSCRRNMPAIWYSCSVVQCYVVVQYSHWNHCMFHLTWQDVTTCHDNIVKWIFFSQCPAIWRAKSCHFSSTNFVKTARWRTVCVVSCHLSRISYELLTKCVTPSLTISSWQVVKPWR